MESAPNRRQCVPFACVLCVLVTSLMQGILGCFPVDDVFKISCLWARTALHDSDGQRLDFCQQDTSVGRGARLTVTVTEGMHSGGAVFLDCLEAFEGHRYLVKRHNSKEPPSYLCVKFSPLTRKVVRDEWSPRKKEKNKVDCLTETYSLHENVIVALEELNPIPCPLAGGFQTVLHQQDDIPRDQQCVQDISTYGPRLQFQCDRIDSSTVLADLGPTCIPEIALDSPAMKGRQVTHLTCVDSWQEEGRYRGAFTSVLLRMPSFNHTFWCLHLQRVSNSAHKELTSAEEILYKAFLTFDGRCLPHIDGEEDRMKPTSMSGKLATFMPFDDLKCQDKAYQQSCVTLPTKCLESTDCPRNCGRCKEPSVSSRCSLPEHLLGTWESFPSKPDDRLDIKTDVVKLPYFGEFICQGPEQPGEVKGIYLLKQTGAHSTCMPYYTCARLQEVYTGLLFYWQFPAQRDARSGEVQNCQETLSDALSSDPDWMAETVTLMQREKLQGVPCHNMATVSYVILNKDLMSDCQLVMHECSGSCQVFNISLDAPKCGNRTAEDAGILTQHVCLGEILMSDGTAAKLTRSEDTNQYLCWVFLSSQIFVVHAHQCNEEQIQAILMSSDPEQDYDTLTMLQKNKPQEIKDGNGVSGVFKPDTSLFLNLVPLNLIMLIAQSFYRSLTAA